MKNELPVSKDEILRTHERIKPYIHRTPVLTCNFINTLVGAELFFKCENLQKAGAFKTRGATNATLSLTHEQSEKGVATHSSGNHAAALSLSARNLNCPAYIVMPENSSRVKIAAVESYGGQITFCKPTLVAREETLAKVINEVGAIEIHPYNDLRIIAGQATAAKELIEDIPGLDYIIAPVGGGGLLSGTALSAHYFSPASIVIAAEPSGADDAFQSFKNHSFVPSINPVTIADGLRTSLGSLTFPIIESLVKDILLTPDSDIIKAMRLTWERMKIIIEPSSAVPLAAIMLHKTAFRGKKIGIILSGGNVDLDELPWIKTDNNG
jgi:threonine dehydratase